MVLCRAEHAHRYTDTADLPPTRPRCGPAGSARSRCTARGSRSKRPSAPTVDASRAAYEAAGIGPEDVDVVQLQDTDAGAEVIHLAENGFCADGEQEALVADGALEIGGSRCRSTPTAVSSPTVSRSARRGCVRCTRSCCSSAVRPANARYPGARRSATRSSTARPARPGSRSSRSEPWTPATRPSRPSCGARPGSSRASSGPSNVADLEDAARRRSDSAARCAMPAGSSCATATTPRRSRWRRSRDRRRRARRAAADVAFAGPVLAGTSRAARGPDRRRWRGGRVLAGTRRRRDRAPTESRRLRCYAVDSDGVGGGLRLGSRRRLASRLGRRVASTTRRRAGSDLTRAGSLDPGRGRPPHAVAGQRRLLTAEDLAAWTALGLAITSADLVGVIRGVLDITVAYAADRRQYGVPVGSFQAVQHLLAEAHCLMEGSHSVALHASWAVDNLAPDDACSAGRGREGVLRARRAHGVRDRDSGARRHRQHLGVHGARVPAARVAVVGVVRRRRRVPRSAESGWVATVGPWTQRRGGAPMDFRDSPAEAEFRSRLRAWLAENNPGFAGVVDRRRVLGAPSRVAHRALRRRILRVELAARASAATTCRPSSM